jgi:hypothetical protein
MTGDAEAAPQAAMVMPDFSGITMLVLREVFDQWRIFERDGRLWGMRGGTVTSEGAESLIRPVIEAGSLKEMAERLSLQEWLRRMSPAELEAVWDGGIAAVAPDKAYLVPEPRPGGLALPRDLLTVFAAAGPAVKALRGAVEGTVPEA